MVVGGCWWLLVGSVGGVVGVGGTHGEEHGESILARVKMHLIKKTAESKKGT